MKIAETYGKLVEETKELEADIAWLITEIASAEADLATLDRYIMEQALRDVTIIAPRFKGRGPATRADKQLDALKDAVEGLELGFKLGDDFQKRSLKELERGGVELAFRNPAVRQALVDRLARAREDLGRSEVLLERKRPTLEDARRRFSALRCWEVVSPAEVLRFPQPRP